MREIQYNKLAGGGKYESVHGTAIHGTSSSGTIPSPCCKQEQHMDWGRTDELRAQVRKSLTTLHQFIDDYTRTTLCGRYISQISCG